MHPRGPLDRKLSLPTPRLTELVRTDSATCLRPPPAVWQLNQNQPFDKIRTLDEITSESLGESRLGTVLLGALAALARLLAAIGIYGVILYSGSAPMK